MFVYILLLSECNIHIRTYNFIRMKLLVKWTTTIIINQTIDTYQYQINIFTMKISVQNQ